MPFEKNREDLREGKARRELSDSGGYAQATPRFRGRRGFLLDFLARFSQNYTL